MAIGGTGSVIITAVHFTDGETEAQRGLAP